MKGPWQNPGAQLPLMAVHCLSLRLVYNQSTNIYGAGAQQGVCGERSGSHPLLPQSVPTWWEDGHVSPSAHDRSSVQGLLNWRVLKGHPWTYENIRKIRSFFFWGWGQSIDLIKVMKGTGPKREQEPLQWTEVTQCRRRDGLPDRERRTRPGRCARNRQCPNWACCLAPGDCLCRGRFGEFLCKWGKFQDWLNGRVPFLVERSQKDSC